MVSTPSSPEKGLALSNSVETSKLIVTQPAKLAELNDLLMTFESFSNKVSERTGEDRSGDMGGAGTGGAKRDDSAKGASPRDQAIAAIPTEPAVLQKQLQQHIEQEVQLLSKRAKALSASIAKPGNANKVNKLYARIRRLNSLLADILEASYDVLKKLFVRVFVDEQPVI